MKWLIIGGTTESIEAVRYLISKKAEIVVSAATEMGRELYRDFPVSVWIGRLNTGEFERKIQEAGITHVLDASHPYAVQVSRIVKNVCLSLNIPYYRYTRKDELSEDGLLPYIRCVPNAEAAADLINDFDGNAALTTGVKTLAVYRDRVMDFQQRCYARVLKNPASEESCLRIFEDNNHWRTENPPFDVEDNRRFIKDTRAAVLVTKDSGTAGGLFEKLEAARLENIPVILIKRPEEEDILDTLEQLNGLF